MRSLALLPFLAFLACGPSEQERAVRSADSIVAIAAGFGAGGCCATGGRWRTRDAKAWERDGKKGSGANSTS